MASRIPGPLGVGANKPVIDKGTMALTNSPLPGPIGIEDTKVSSYSSSILESVGRGGRNLPKDVRTVQKLLNDTTLHSLAIDGIMGMNTLDAIKEFQERVVGMHRPDCRVDPNGRTFRMLVEYKPTKSTTFKHSLSGGTHIIVGGNGVQMVMLVRSRKEYFTDFIVREAKANGLKVVVNGSFIDLSVASSVSVLTGSDPLEASESTPLGRVIQDGRLLAGISSTAKFSFSQNTCGVEKFSASLGNPPSSSCSAIGGIAPIIIDSLPYGAVNTYKAGVPSGAPLTGDVDAKFRPFLTQKSNAMFATLLSKGGTIGKTAIGYSNSKQALVILSQAHGQSGFDANGIRAIFNGYGVSNAVFLDCSDSATLYYDGKFLVRPGTNKNEFLTVAVGFK